jgi:hypothetical protein
MNDRSAFDAEFDALTSAQEELVATGCDLAAAHAEPGSLSQHNVERLGFRLVYTKVMMCP